MAGKVAKRRQKKVEEMPLCKYGEACYQKNAEHLAKYRHPTPKPSRKKDEPKKDEIDQKPLPKKKKTSEDISICSSADLNKFMKEVFLVEMPADFYHFWEFCCTVDNKNPEEIFSELGLHLVGPYDVLSKKFDVKEKSDATLCHWRYYFDPPEFQTVVKKDGKDFFHIGYYRDDPSEMPGVVASNCAAIGAKLNLMGDNIFAAMDSEVKKCAENANKALQGKYMKIREDMQKFAKAKKYSLDSKSPKTKARDKKVVSKSFHGLGIVVPYDKKNDLGYRPLPDSDATLKSLLKRISAAKSEQEKIKGLDDLQEIITNVQFANDECDYGMGLELGTDLFCFGDSCLHGEIRFLLPLAYELLRRPQFGEIIKAHLQNRKEGDDLSMTSPVS